MQALNNSEQPEAHVPLPENMRPDAVQEAQRKFETSSSRAKNVARKLLDTIHEAIKILPPGTAEENALLRFSLGLLSAKSPPSANLMKISSRVPIVTP